MNVETNQAKEAEPLDPPGVLQKIVSYTRDWLYLNVWCSYLYRPTMRVLHRFNLHHAPPDHIQPTLGFNYCRCSWCGLQGQIMIFKPGDPGELEPLAIIEELK